MRHAQPPLLQQWRWASRVKKNFTYFSHRCHLFPYHPPALRELPHLREKKSLFLGGGDPTRIVPQTPALVLGAWDEGTKWRL